MIRCTAARVDLDASRANYRAIADYLTREAGLNQHAGRGATAPPGIIAVIKANAYGHGAVRIARALEDISKIISFRPDSPRVAGSYAIRAMLHHRIGDPAKGLPDADRAVGLDPRSAMALYIRARIYEALGRSEDAAAGVSAALAIDPGIREKMERMERSADPRRSPEP